MRDGTKKLKMKEIPNSQDRAIQNTMPIENNLTNKMPYFNFFNKNDQDFQNVV